jgi:hypothetical protein
MSRLVERLLFALTLLLMLGDAAHAAGSYQKQPMFPGLVVAGVPTPPVALPSVPQINPAQFFRGCGRGRVRDTHTNLCYGPADVGH